MLALEVLLLSRAFGTQSTGESDRRDSDPVRRGGLCHDPAPTAMRRTPLSTGGPRTRIRSRSAHEQVPLPSTDRAWTAASSAHTAVLFLEVFGHSSCEADMRR